MDLKVCWQSAAQHHSRKEYSKAQQYYEIFASKSHKLGVPLTENFFANYGSLLNAVGNKEKAVTTYQEGLAKYPDSASISLNYANLLISGKSAKPWLAISLLSPFLVKHPQQLTFEALRTLHLAYTQISLTIPSYNSALMMLARASSPNEAVLALQFVIDALFRLPDKLLTGISFRSEDLSPLIRRLKAKDLIKGTQYYALLFSLMLRLGDYTEALRLHKEYLAYLSIHPISTSKEWSMYHVWTWNLAIKLVQNGVFEPGWKFYNSGLVTPAEGPQRWQRSLPKPFSIDQVPIWNGEKILNGHILVIGEQGIGDAMMFISLIPNIYRLCKYITVLVNDRLYSIYSRSLQDCPSVSVISNIKKLKSRQALDNPVTCQIPSGSLPAILFSSPTQAATTARLQLTTELSRTKQIRQRYYKGKPLIGISWQGGGIAKRIPMKSIPLEKLLPILNIKGLSFVSLQYGNAAGMVQKLSSKYDLDFVHDDSINPLKDMDSWLHQVDSMDAIVTIANTTVHGSAGLAKPTYVLLSKTYDWRWTPGEIFPDSYWYPSIRAYRQEENGDWTSAVKAISQALQSDFL